MSFLLESSPVRVVLACNPTTNTLIYVTPVTGLVYKLTLRDSTCPLASPSLSEMSFLMKSSSVRVVLTCKPYTNTLISVTLVTGLVYKLTLRDSASPSASPSLSEMSFLLKSSSVRVVLTCEPYTNTMISVTPVTGLVYKLTIRDSASPSASPCLSEITFLLKSSSVRVVLACKPSKNTLISSAPVTRLVYKLTLRDSASPSASPSLSEITFLLKSSSVRVVLTCKPSTNTLISVIHVTRLVYKLTIRDSASPSASPNLSEMSFLLKSSSVRAVSPFKPSTNTLIYVTHVTGLVYKLTLRHSARPFASSRLSVMSFLLKSSSVRVVLTCKPSTNTLISVTPVTRLVYKLTFRDCARPSASPSLSEITFLLKSSSVRVVLACKPSTNTLISVTPVTGLIYKLTLRDSANPSASPSLSEMSFLLKSSSVRVVLTCKPSTNTLISVTM